VTCLSHDSRTSETLDAIIDYLRWAFESTPEKLTEYANALCAPKLTPLQLLYYNHLSQSSVGMLTKLISIGTHLATSQCILELTFQLLGADVNIKGDFHTVLYESLARSDVQSTTYLIEKLKVPPPEPSEWQPDLLSPIGHIASTHHDWTIPILNYFSATCDINERMGDAKITALYIATKSNNSNLIRKLLDHGADPMIPDVYGDLPIAISVRVRRL